MVHGVLRVAWLALLPGCASLHETRTESLVSARPFERQVDVAPQDRLRASTDGRIAEVHVERFRICGMQKAEQRITAIRREQRADAGTVRGEALVAGGLGATGVAGAGIALRDHAWSPAAAVMTSLVVPAVVLGVVAIVDATRGGAAVAYRLDNVPLAFSPRDCGSAPLPAVDVVLACDSGIRLKAITDKSGVAKIPLGPVPGRGLDCTLSAPGTPSAVVHLHVVGPAR